MPATKMGRPLSQNPKTKRITIRMDVETAKMLENYSKENNIEKAEVVRQGIKLMISGTKK